MWKGIPRKSRYYLSCSLQTHTHAHMHTFASAQLRSHNLRKNNVVQQFRLTLPEQLLKQFESFIKASAFGRRSKYTAGLVLPLLSKETFQCISMRTLMNHRAKFLMMRVCKRTWEQITPFLEDTLEGCSYCTFSFSARAQERLVLRSPSSVLLCLSPCSL